MKLFNISFNSKFILFSLYSIFSNFIKICKFSYIWGSNLAFFNLNQAIFPALGLNNNISSLFIFYLIKIISNLIFLKISILNILFFNIPSLIGALFFNINNKLIKILFLLSCIALFITHPIGNQAFLYSFYWFIPIFILLIDSKSIFLKSLASSFTIHAAGSIIYLFTSNLTANNWNQLIYLVWLERLILALGIYSVYYCYTYLNRFLQKLLEKLESNYVTN